MDITDKRIDSGKAFDWGRTSEDYAKYRDIYPDIFYRKITDRNLCVSPQKVLDLGTGTGVLPRNMYRYGAEWTGTDISPEQIEQAEILAAAGNMNIRFLTVSAEHIDFPPGSFDTVTACQCFWYFDHSVVIPEIARVLRPGGKLLILYMAWLPYEDPVAGASEELVLRFSPQWSGFGETVHPIEIPQEAYKYFEEEEHEEYRVPVHFTRESWHGRMKACRGVGASLNKEELAEWEKEHIQMLERIAADEFDVMHYAALSILRKK